MPRVPVYEQQAGGISRMPTPNVARPDPDSFGAPIVRGVEQVAGATERAAVNVNDAYKQERARANEFRLAKADTELEAAINDGLHNSDDGFLNKSGEQALNDKPYVDRFSKKRDDILKTLDDPQLQERWRVRADDKLSNTRAQMEVHVAGQRNRVYADVADGQMKTALSTVELNAGDQGVVEKAIHGVLVSPDGGAGPLRLALMANGKPNDIIDAEEKAFTARAWATSVQALAKKDPAAAVKQFEEKRTELGSQATEMEQLVRTAQRDQQGEVFASAIVGASKGPGGWVDEAGARKKLDEIQDIHVRDETQKRLEFKLDRAKEEKKAYLNSAFDKALNEFQTRGRSSTLIDSDLKTILQDPNNDPTLWEKFITLEQNAQNRVANAPPTPAQIRAYGAFLVDSARNPAKYSTQEGVSWFNANVLPNLAYSDWDKATGRLSTLQAAANKGTEKLGPIEDRMLLNKGREAGIFPQISDTSKWSDDQFGVYYKLQQEIHDRMVDFRRTNGKEAPADVVQKWVSDQLTTVVNPKTGTTILGITFGQKKTTRIQAQMKGEEAVPEALMPKLREALKKAGQEDTPENLLNAYRLTQGGNKPAPKRTNSDGGFDL